MRARGYGYFWGEDKHLTTVTQRQRGHPKT
jgi:hypothetical protein